MRPILATLRSDRPRHVIECYLVRRCGNTRGNRTMSAQRPILIVEDDETLRELVAEHLADGHDFTVVTAATLEEADQAIDNKDARFDAVILDIGMPDGDGRDYCAKLRRQGHKMP